MYHALSLLVLCVWEDWSLQLREEHRLRVFKEIFGPKRDEVMGVVKTR